MNSDLLMSLIISKEKFESTTGRTATVFVCSKELADEIGTETVLRCPIEVDETLFGINDYFWM